MCINEILDKIYVHYFFTSIVFVDYNKIIFYDNYLKIKVYSLRY